MKWAYEMKDEELLDVFMSACAEAGVGGSGLVIDLSGSNYLGEAHYLKGVILARLENQKPPLLRGQKIKPKLEQGVGPHWPSGYYDPLPADKMYTVRRIFYDGAGRWLVDFEHVTSEGGRPRYAADEFLAIEEVGVASR